MEQVCAIGVVGGDAVQLFVADVEASLAVHRAAGGPDELAAVQTVAAEVAEVSAIGVAHGDADAAGGLFLAAADDIETVIPPHGGIHRVIEAPALHNRHAHSVGVFH